MKGLFENKSPLAKLCMLVCILLVCTGVASCLSYACLLLTGNPQSPGNLRMLLFLQNSLLFIAAPLAAQYLFDSRPLADSLQLNHPSPALLLLGCMSIVCIGPFVDMLNTWNQSLHLPESLQAVEQWMAASERQAEALTRQLLDVDTWGGFAANLAVIALLAGIGEELLFRGVIQKQLIRWSRNRHMGILLTAALFSAVHLQFFGFFPRLALGILLGYLYLWGRNLWIPVTAHTLNNAWVIIFTPNGLNQGNRLVETWGQVENHPVYVVAGLLLTGLCLYGLRRTQRSLPSN